MSRSHSTKPSQEDKSDAKTDLWWPHQRETSNECTVLVQVDDVDLTGATGAIGRIEVVNDQLILDIKGNKYHGKLFPGPTCWVVQQQKDERVLKIEGATDEFVRLVPLESSDFHAKVQGDYSHDYQVKDDNVNRKGSDNVAPPATKKARKNK